MRVSLCDYTEPDFYYADMGLTAASHQLPVLHRETKDLWSEAFSTNISRNYHCQKFINQDKKISW